MSQPSFHWIWSAVLRLRSSFAPPSGSPHQLRFESAMAQYGRQLASRRVLVSTQSVIFWKVSGPLCRVVFGFTHTHTHTHNFCHPWENYFSILKHVIRNCQSKQTKRTWPILNSFKKKQTKTKKNLIDEFIKLNVEGSLTQCSTIHETHNSLKTCIFSPHAIKTCHWQDMLQCSPVKIKFHFC